MMYNPLIHKKPYGATAVGKETTIVFPLDSAMGVKRVFVVLRQQEGEGASLLRYEMTFDYAKDGVDFFRGAFALSQYGIWRYRFEGELENGEIAFFGRGTNGCAVRGDWLPEWQLSVSKYDYKTPDWSKHGIIYHVFADRFCKGEERVFDKKGKLHTDWYQTPDVPVAGEDYRADDFFGGNIEGIISKLDYLEQLGVSCIYLSPIFESSSNHRYDTGDYLKIDKLFGDETQLKRLIDLAAKRDMRIMLDGVFNHTGADSVYFNKFGNYQTLGAYQSEQSPYFDWYYFNKFPDDYHCWWGSTVVPTVNKSAQGFRDLILGDGGVIDKWTDMGVAGWRLDVVDELPIDFTSALCAKIKSKGEDTFIVGEVWEDASTKISYGEWRPYLMGGQLDSVMNYPFKKAITDYVLTGCKEDFVCDVTHILENYPKQSLDCLMNLIDSHDTVRVLTKLAGVSAPATKQERAEFHLSDDKYVTAKHRLMIASFLQYTLPGIPCLFYGDEAGVQGFEDPLNRVTYPWEREDGDLIAHYRELGVLRKRYSDYFCGETHFVEEKGALVFDRICEKGILRVIVEDSALRDNGSARVELDGRTIFVLKI